jgi:hypothetical protein
VQYLLISVFSCGVERDGDGPRSQPEGPARATECLRKCPEFFALLIWAERRPVLAQAVMTPLIC